MFQGQIEVLTFSGLVPSEVDRVRGGVGEGFEFSGTTGEFVDVQIVDGRFDVGSPRHFLTNEAGTVHGDQFFRGYTPNLDHHQIGQDGEVGKAFGGSRSRNDFGTAWSGNEDVWIAEGVNDNGQ